MSPYQQQVIDASMAEYENQTAQKQAALGTGAGSAFGGGRFGVAQGQLAGDAARGGASLKANLLGQGFQQANQLAAQASQQRLGIGQQAMQQAQQNQGMFGTAAQLQSGLGQQAMGAAQADIGNLMQTGQAQGQLAQSQMSPYQQSLSANMQMANAIPQFNAQQFGILSSFGDQQQKYQQAGLDAISQRNKLQQYAPYEQMGFIGSQLASMMGGYGGGYTTGSTTAPGATGMEKTLGAAGVGSGIAANLGSLFGFGTGGTG